MKLVNFLKKLRNEQVTVELKNGTTVWGTLQTVSPQMNATLTDVRLSLPRPTSNSNSGTLAGIYLANGRVSPNEPTTVSLQYINIRGNTIRQIILPDSLNIDTLLVDEKQLSKLRRAGKVVSDPTKKRRAEYGENVSKRIRRGI